MLQAEKQDDDEQVILKGDEVWPEIEDGEEDQCFMGIKEKECETFTQEAAGAAALDSCCSRTLCGDVWLETYKKMMSKVMKEQLKGPLTATSPSPSAMARSSSLKASASSLL